MITIDTEKAIIWGANGSASYYINDSGGLELTDSVDDGLTDAEFAEAEKELAE
jgi:hypothetical protein